MEPVQKKVCNLTNKDFRELIKNHIPTKKVDPQVEIKREISRVKKAKKPKAKIYDKKKREDALEQLLLRYRDRARERREGKNPDYLATSDPLVDPIAYHAVGPDAKYNQRLQERRKQLIQESKYLGGDMAHTHLVKGLDFSLLNKVRSEIEAKTNEVTEELEEIDEEGLKGQMAKNIQSILFDDHGVAKNPLFAPGKMSYLVELGCEEAETDVPMTVIHSRVVTTETGQAMITTDGLIERIRMVMEGLKEGANKYKKSKKSFEVEQPQECHPERKEEKTHQPKVHKKTEAMLKKLSAEPTGYAECYPGHEAMFGTADDSDVDEDHPPEAESGPRAAYQFGLKKTGGRRTRMSEKEQKASLDREWARIRGRLHI